MLPDRPARFLTRVLGSFVTLILAVAGADGAAMPPRYKFQTLQSGRVAVHFHKEVETPARLVMSLALEVLPRLEERYRVRVPSLDIVVHDANDSANGLASSFPYPFVEIRTAAPDGGDSGPTESWLRMVVTHELTHIVHIEEAGGLYRLGRRVLGRAPFLFPNALQPTWFIEGLAVREETRGTAFGRGRHAFTEMVVDEAARAGQLGRLDQATLGLDLWPLGNAPYLFGEEFLAWLEKERGETITQDLALSHASSLRPYLDNLTFQRVTGRSVQTLWTEFSRDRAKSLGGSSGMAVVEPRPLTTRGAVQTSPRLSPDGSTLAYTSRTLDRLGEIRTMRIDGSADRRLTTRTSGSALSWSADGATIVFDETNQVSKFESRSDLYSVDAKTGRRTRLTHGLRASDPDLGPIGPPGQTEIVFVQRFADRSELSLLDLKTLKAITLTHSEPGTEWSHPRFSPHGDVIVASRLAQGFSDLVIVDAGKGASRNLLHDRALDVEPSWVDENTIIFRSDREGTGFRLFVISSEGKELSRTSSDAVNAFTPEVDQRTASLFYSTYSSRGYDLARLPFQRGQSPAAFDDTFPANRSDPLPFPGDARPYSALKALAPRFVTPFAEVVADEWRFGLATASADPLFRLTYAVAGSLGRHSSRPNGLGYLRYDRLAPTFTALARTESSPEGLLRRDLAEGRFTLDWPLERSTLRSQTLSASLRRRRESAATQRLDTGVAALVWNLDSTKAYPRSISPQDGVRLRVAATRELKALGSHLDFGKLIADGRAYVTIGPTVLASRLGLGWTFGPQPPRNAFAVGGLPSPALLDPVGDEPALLRGYKKPVAAQASRFGKRVAFANLDWRIPLAHPQRGIGVFPFFLRRIHVSVALDGAVISNAGLALNTARVGASIGLGADIFLAHRIPLTLEGGVGRGLTRDGLTVPWVSIGLPF